MVRHLRALAISAMLGSVWLGSLVGPTGTTLGSFTSASTNPANNFSTSNALGVAPVLGAITPYDTATEVAINAKITVSFSEAMNQTTSASAFSLQPITGASSTCTGGTGLGTAVSVTPSWNASATFVVFTPSSNLATNTCFRVTVTTAATDSTYGLHLALDSTATFKSGSATSTAAPQVVPPTSPSGNSVATNAPIQITFSETMNQTTAQNAFTLQVSGGGCFVYPTTTNPCAPSGGSFSWSGAAQNTLTFLPNGSTPTTGGLTTSTQYTVAVGTGAQDLYGNGLAASANNTFNFTTTTGVDNTAPAVPTAVTPSTALWTTNTTYTVTGQVEANALVKILDTTNGNRVVSSIQLTGGLTDFSLTVPLLVGANTFAVVAVDAAGNQSLQTAVGIITRNDPKTDPVILTLSPSYTSVIVVASFTGDANNVTTATYAYCQGNGCTLGSSATMGAALNGQFTKQIPGLISNRSTTVQVELTNSQFGFASITACNAGTSGSNGSISPINCDLTATTTTLQSPSGAGTISAVTLSPSGGVIAPAASQQQAFNVTYDCGAGCTQGSVQVAINTSSKHSQNSDSITNCVNGPAAQTGTVTPIWNGKLPGTNGALARDDTYGFEVQLFGSTNCHGTVVAATTQTTGGSPINVITVNDAQSVSLTPLPNTVTLNSTGQSAHIMAAVTNYLGNPVADGDSTISGTEASVSFTAVGSQSSTGFSLSRSSSAVGHTYSGDASGGCNPSAGTGKACVTLTVNSPVAQTITITATAQSQTSSGAGTSFSAQTTILDPPLPPSGLTLTPGSINVAWNASATKNVAGYKILLGKASGKYDRVIDAGNVTNYHIVDVDPGATYYVAVQSYTDEGLATPLTVVPEAWITLPPATATPTATLTATPTVNPCTSPSATATSPATATATSSATTTATLTITPTATPTCVPTATATSTATMTSTATASATATLAAATSTPTATATSAPTATLTPVPTVTPTQAPSSTPTPTPTQPPTSTPTAVLPTSTSTRTATAVPATNTPTRTATP